MSWASKYFFQKLKEFRMRTAKLFRAIEKHTLTIFAVFGVYLDL